MTVAAPDIIEPAAAMTLAGLFAERVRRTPHTTAYRHFDVSRDTWVDTTWADMGAMVARWQAGLQREGLRPGDRVAVMLRNCREWVMLDQAALGLGLVVVPLYASDRTDNLTFVLNHAGAKLLLIEGDEQWQQVAPAMGQLPNLARVLTLVALSGAARDERVQSLDQWLPAQAHVLETRHVDPHDLATIVYTSGTTGRPKGVMLSHYNILSNAHSCLCIVPVTHDDVFLSFLPLSHTLERTVGYYLAVMAGATVAYNRAITLLADDLLAVRPTVVVSVPRIYERFFRRIQEQLAAGSRLARALFQLTVHIGWRRFERRHGRKRWTPVLVLWPALDRLVARKVLRRFGGRVRAAICGGAPLPDAVGRVFIGFGLPVLHGYGMTETSPVVSANRLEDNEPRSVGTPIPGATVKIGQNEELLVSGDGVMLGYWNDPEATAATIDGNGWLHTGDKARIDGGRIYITGRIKEIIVLANGEKVPPADMEMAIEIDPLFEQVMVVGEQRPYLGVLAVLNEEHWREICSHIKDDRGDETLLTSDEAEELVLKHIAKQLRHFPGYAQVRRAALLLEKWTVENGLITPTLKPRRERILARHGDLVERLYTGH